jgi:hypothetical protein
MAMSGLLVMWVLTGCNPLRPVVPQALTNPSAADISTSSSLCGKPVANADQLQSNYLPLAVGNQWQYKRTILRDIYAWEGYAEEKEDGKSELQFLVGQPSGFAPGESTETYIITGTVEKGGLQFWEVQVSSPQARDGRYGGVYTQPDRILWGRVASSAEIIEIDEILTQEAGYFIGAKREERILVVEPLIQDNVQATLSHTRLPEIQYTALPDLTQVDVPAGKFSCSVEVVTKVDTDQFKWETHSFYAPHIGLVKEVQYDDAGKVTYTLELVQYKLS